MVYVWSIKHKRYLNLADPEQRVLDNEGYYDEARRLQAEYMATLSPRRLRWEKFKMFFGCGKYQA